MSKSAIVCAPVMPEFDRESGSRRLYDLIVLLQELGWRVVFACRKQVEANRYSRLLEQRGVAVYTGVDAKAAAELFQRGSYDLALCAFWNAAEELLPALRAAAPRTRLIVDSVDVHFLRMARAAFCGSTNGDVRQMELERGAEIIRELNTYAAADAVLTVSGKETNLLDDFLGHRVPVFTVPDCDELRPGVCEPDGRRGLLFLGNFRHPPNVSAAEFLLREIVPLLGRRLLQEHPLYIVGNALDGRLREFASDECIRLVGWVPTVEPYLQAARVSVSPLLYGAGTKRKLIQSLLAGTPTVCTGISVEGLGLHHGSEVLIADDPASFAAAITQLLSDGDLWRRLAAGGTAFIKQAHARDAVKDKLRDALSSVLSLPTRPAPAAMKQRQPYPALVERIRATVDRTVPAGASIAVVAKGDPRLLLFDGVRGVPFPQDKHGAYAGHHPRDSQEAIERLEDVRRMGVDYLLFPATALWWLEHYREFAAYLDESAKRVWADDDGVVFQLGADPRNAQEPATNRRGLCRA